MKATRQLELRFGTAENLGVKASRSDGGLDEALKSPEPFAEPKPNTKRESGLFATLERVVARLELAFSKVEANKGAPGPDRQSIAEVRKHLDKILPVLAQSLLDGSYRPGDVRRVWIPKSGSGLRGLGIPNVIDRVVQEAVREVIEPLYEPSFHPSSHGFRPRRGCHTAIAEAKKHVEEGYEYVVDIDLEKFFDRVNHQRLMARLAERVEDKRILILINQMLKAKVILPEGVRVSTDEGVPQGGPLSPLLSNIVLHELDQELEQRGHRFVRYADDCNIYVKSVRAGERVMGSISHFINKRLRLKINADKSAVAKPEERHFLGFRLKVEILTETVEVLLSKRSKERIYGKLREMLPRARGQSMSKTITDLNVYLKGWLAFFGICTKGAEASLGAIDAHTRRRLRAMQLKQWKTKRTITRKLIKLGVKSKTAWQGIYKGRRSLWYLSHCPAVERGLRNAYFAKRGLVSLQERWRKKFESNVAQGHQLSMSFFG